MAITEVPMNATAEAIMSRNPITCSPSDSLNAAAQQMWEHDIGALPVTNAAGHVVGMLTDRDIAMAAYTQGKPLDRMTVQSAMSVSVWSVEPQSSVAEVEALMRQHQVRRIPVVDGGRRPIGMVSLNDLARRAAPTRGALVTQEEIARTLRAVCEPRDSAAQAPAVAE
jgi:CBS domain-containing protein